MQRNAASLLLLLGVTSLGSPSCTGAIDGAPVMDGAGSGTAGNRGAPTSGNPTGGGGSASAPTSGTMAGPAAPSSTCGGTEIEPGPSPIRRLTRFEYNNVVRDLLGDGSRPADGFPPEEEAAGFDNDAGSLGSSRLLIEHYAGAAKAIAQRATLDLVKLLGCDPVKDGEDPCAQKFIDRFGERAFRRPLSLDERSRFLALVNADKEKDDFRTRVQTLLRVVLQMPQFLYRVELGTAVAGNARVAKLDSWETASRLSFLLWGSMPDDQLFVAARSGALETKEQVATQAQRMLKDAKARDVVRRFHDFAFDLRGMEGLEKDAKLFPSFTRDIALAMRGEADRFLDHVVWEGSGDVQGLLTASYTFLHENLAKFYGITGVTSRTMVQFNLDPTRGSGLLTLGGVLARLAKNNRTDPIKRGVFVRALMCEVLPEPPPDVPPEDLNVDPKLPARERLAMHRASPSCSSCHALIDPIGFGFENIDAVGRWRTLENGKAIDGRGEVAGSDIAGPFVGPVEIGKKLASSPSVQRCLVGKWFQFAYGRPPDPADRCSRAQLDKALSGAGKIKDLLLALTQADAFRYRRAVVP